MQPRIRAIWTRKGARTQSVHSWCAGTPSAWILHSKAPLSTHPHRERRLRRACPHAKNPQDGEPRVNHFRGFPSSRGKCNLQNQGLAPAKPCRCKVIGMWIGRRSPDMSQGYHQRSFQREAASVIP